ncbi:TetR family transcriptional regulator [Paraburkholderia sp. CI3]|uniref:TetR family transcriptional regulator n=1 Tax=Paraburkholderia sp. CI3 TaxID=2991060 RepID=UPI003D1FBEC9
MERESRKKNHLVETALRLFNRDGFHATGVDTVLAEADISKTVLYKHFRSKDELIVYTLRQVTTQARAMWDAMLNEERRTPEQKLLARFDQLKQAVEVGLFHRCIFLQSCGEFGEENHPIHQAAIEYKLASLDFTRALVKQLQVNRPDLLARDIDLVYEGVLAKLHAKHDVTYIADAKRLVKLLIQARTRAPQAVSGRAVR